MINGSHISSFVQTVFRKYQDSAVHLSQNINCKDSYLAGTQSVLNIPETNVWYLWENLRLKKKQKLLLFLNMF